MFKFKSFKARILFFFITLLVLVQLTVFISVNTANIKNATSQIEGSLAVTAGALKQIIHERNRRLIEFARVLSSDFAFKQAIATRDMPTMISVLDNHRARIDADAMLLVSFEGGIIANTLHPEKAGDKFPDDRIIKLAEKSGAGEASSLVMLEGKVYQMVVVPLLVPTPEAWVIVGFIVDAPFAKDLERVTQSHISFLARESDRAGWAVFASTLPEKWQGYLPPSLDNGNLEINKNATIIIDGSEHVAFVIPLMDEGKTRVAVVLQRSLADAMAPYSRLRVVLASLFVVGLALFAVGSVFISRTVTKPVSELVAMTHKVEDGDYTASVSLGQADEMGKLATAFNHMVRGLAERDRVQNLLGKVVSPAVAEELLVKGIELGGEEKEVSVLFTDIRGFTNLSEKYRPHEVLSILNVYFTGITSVVERNSGVVDKYIGDAMMALFGAPLTHEDDAERAVIAALEIRQELDRMNEDFIKQGFPKLEMGVGINTAVVVAGNMGSTSRLNYTVIGDGVNIASRIEGLCKRYGVFALVTATTKDKARSFVYREIDKVRVKGKTETIVIYEPIGRKEEAEQAAIDELDEYETALNLYRKQRWVAARDMFLALNGRQGGRQLYNIYLSRIDTLMKNDPGEEWDGVTEFFDK